MPMALAPCWVARPRGWRDNIDMNDKSIESSLSEKRSFPPPAGFAHGASPGSHELHRLHERAAHDPEGFWAEQAHTSLVWHKPFTRTLDESEAPNYRWFTDGQLNASYNCLDVHLAARRNHTALIFEAENGTVRRLTYGQLHAEVCKLGNALRALGVKSGDRVVIYMPLVPEAIVAMQACARIGAIHSVVFGGFSALSMRDRIEDAEARFVITADGGHRGGKVVELKAATDKALAEGGATIEIVIVLRPPGLAVPMRAGRYLWWHELPAGERVECHGSSACLQT